MSFRLQKGEDFYRIVGPKGEEGEAVVYGEPATLITADGNLYLAYCEDLDDDEEADETLEDKIFLCTPVPTTVEEDMEFVDEDGAVLVLADDDEDDEGEGEGDDDDDEDAIVDTDDDDEDGTGNGELPAA